MGLISKAAVLGVGYLLGARAGRQRYDQMVEVVSRAAARPELAPYLTPVVALLSDGTGRPDSVSSAQLSPPAAAAGDSTATAPVDLSPPLPDPPPAASGGRRRR